MPLLNRFFKLPRDRGAAGAAGAWWPAHIIALHEVGFEQPGWRGDQGKKKKDAKGIPLDGIPFHPFYTVARTIYAVSRLPDDLQRGAVLRAGGAAGYFLEYNNFIEANPLKKTPPHIAPVWYFTPYYSMLARNHRPDGPTCCGAILAVGGGAGHRQGPASVGLGKILLADRG